LQGHRQDIWLAVLKDNGRFLVTASQDSEVRLWDLQAGTCQQIWHPSLPYAGMDITAINNLSEATVSLISRLGAQVNRR
jgi:WD40 repeat protein